MLENNEELYLGHASDDSDIGHGISSDGSGSVLSKIEARGGSMQLYSALTWEDGSEEASNADVVWKSADESVLTVDQSGLVKAHANGKTKVEARVPAARTISDDDLVCWIWVEVHGQDDTPYITALEILGPDGERLPRSGYTLESELATAMVQFYAEATVSFPASGETKTLSTKDGPLESQAPGLGKLYWYVADATLSSVNDETGLYRPTYATTNVLYVSTSATLSGESMKASTVITTVDPTSEQNDDAHPQETFTVRAYYQTYPPTANRMGVYSDDDPAFVINDTFSLEDLMTLGTVTQTYTAITMHGDAYYTITGQGVPFASVLTAAGIELKGINQISFRTADWPTGLAHPVSPDSIFGDRYFYPNYDVGDTATKEQVYPIIAWKSSQKRNVVEVTDEEDLTDATKYRLLYGALEGTSNANNSVKWINTVYVELKGPNHEEDTDGSESSSSSGSTSSSTSSSSSSSSTSSSGQISSSTSSGDSDPSHPSDETPSRSTTNEEPTTPIAADEPTAPDVPADPNDPNSSDDGGPTGGGSDSNDNGGDDSGKGSGSEKRPAAVSGRKASEGTDADARGDAGAKLSTDVLEESAEESAPAPASAPAAISAPAEASAADSSTNDSGKGRFSVYQIINNFDSNTAALPDDNPIRPYAGPAGLVALLAGCVQAAWWYRRQRGSAGPTGLTG